MNRFYSHLITLLVYFSVIQLNAQQINVTINSVPSTVTACTNNTGYNISIQNTFATAQSFRIVLTGAGNNINNVTGSTALSIVSGGINVTNIPANSTINNIAFTAFIGCEAIPTGTAQTGVDIGINVTQINGGSFSGFRFIGPNGSQSLNQAFFMNSAQFLFPFINSTTTNAIIANIPPCPATTVVTVPYTNTGSAPFNGFVRIPALLPSVCTGFVVQNVTVLNHIGTAIGNFQSPVFPITVSFAGVNNNLPAQESFTIVYTIAQTCANAGGNCIQNWNATNPIWPLTMNCSVPCGPFATQVEWDCNNNNINNNSLCRITTPRNISLQPTVTAPDMSITRILPENGSQTGGAWESVCTGVGFPIIRPVISWFYEYTISGKRSFGVR